MNVTIPVAVEKSPMKEEYSFGLGNCTVDKGYYLLSKLIDRQTFQSQKATNLCFELRFPRNLDKVDTDAIRDHQSGKIPDVP